MFGKASSSAAGSSPGANQRSSATSSAGVGLSTDDARSPAEVERRVPVLSVAIGDGADETARLDLEARLLTKLPPQRVERLLELVHEAAEDVPLARRRARARDGRAGHGPSSSSTSPQMAGAGFAYTTSPQAGHRTAPSSGRSSARQRGQPIHPSSSLTIVRRMTA